ncbi:MAG: exo-alpha-sialidase [Deltaproteobacteria bacterium]|nr:exo-alpha-sialidase [Deltaproteobacteria bacterium]
MLRLLARQVFPALLALALTACGGGQSIFSDGGPDDGSTATDSGTDAGDAGPIVCQFGDCQFDVDCAQFSVCNGTCCVPNCLVGGCPAGLVCQASGHCIHPEGVDSGTLDAGAQDGGQTDSGTSDSGTSDGGPLTDGGVCLGSCQFDSDCSANGILVCGEGNCCVATCGFLGCPGGEICLANGHCAPDNDGGPIVDGGPIDAGPADGGPRDGGAADSGSVDAGAGGDTSANAAAPLSGNINGCGADQACQINQDCSDGTWCGPGVGVPGACRVPCSDSGWLGTVTCILTDPASTLSTASCTTSGMRGDGSMYCLGDQPVPTLSDGGTRACNPVGYVRAASPTSTCAITLPAPAWAEDYTLTGSAQPLDIAVAPAVYAGQRVVALVGHRDTNGHKSIATAHSTNDGVNWSDTAGVPGSGGQNRDPALAHVYYSDSGGSHERIFAAWVHGTLDNGADRQPFIETSSTDNDGASWTTMVRATTSTAHQNDSLAFDHPVAAQTGQTIALAWNAAGATSSTSGILTTVSHDLGAHWGSTFWIAPLAGFYNQHVSLAYDPTGASGSPRLFAAFTSWVTAGTSSSYGVYVTYSDNDGAGWSAPFAVTTDLGTSALQETPSLAIDNAHTLYVAYANDTALSQWTVNLAVLQGPNPTSVLRSGKANDHPDCAQVHGVKVAVSHDDQSVALAWLSNQGDGYGRAYSNIVTQLSSLTFAGEQVISGASFFFDPRPDSAGPRTLGSTMSIFYEGSSQSHWMRAAWLDPRKGTQSLPRYNAGPP